jgi:hypothetical protein
MPHLNGIKDNKMRLEEFLVEAMEKKLNKIGEEEKDEDKEEDLEESSAPGQEAWIKSNKAKFIKEYGKKKGMEVLYATAWKRSKGK